MDNSIEQTNPLHLLEPTLNFGHLDEDEIRGRDPKDEEDDDDEAPVVKKGGRRKINIEFIENKSRRHVTFSKRKAGLIKKVNIYRKNKPKS